MNRREEPATEFRLCVCGRLIVSMAGMLDYCAGCGQAICSCVIRSPERDPRLLPAPLNVERLAALAQCVEALGFVAVNVSWDEVQQGVEVMVAEALAAGRSALSALPSTEPGT